MKLKYFVYTVFVFIVLIVLFGHIINFYYKKQINSYEISVKAVINLLEEGIFSGYFNWDSMYEAFENDDKEFKFDNFSEIISSYKYVKDIEVIDKKDFEGNYYTEINEGSINIYFNIFDDNAEKSFPKNSIKILIDTEAIFNDIDFLKIMNVSSEGKNKFLGGINFNYRTRNVNYISFLTAAIMSVIFYFIVYFHDKANKKYKKTDMWVKNLLDVPKFINEKLKINDYDKETFIKNDFFKEYYHFVRKLLPECDAGTFSVVENGKWKMIFSDKIDTEKFNDAGIEEKYMKKTDEVIIVKNLNEFNNNLIEDYPKLRDSLYPIKESIFFPIKGEKKYYGTFSFDITEKSKEKFGNEEKELIKAFAASMYNYISVMEKDIQNVQMKLEIVYSLVDALEIYDSYTRGHSDNVSEIAVRFGKYLGLPEDDINKLYWAGLLHDVGKLFINNSILNKKTKFTDYEYDEMKKHTIKGYELLSKRTGLKEIANIILYHHERYDGKGYPEKLYGESIPYLSRIINICDSFDAMVSERPYKNSMTVEEAITEIKNVSGKQFDKNIANKFTDFVLKNYF